MSRSNARSLHILDAEGVDRALWNRGFGDIELKLIDKSQNFFGARKEQMRIYDHQGSLLSPGKSPAIPDYETWAEFVSEIAKQMKANGEGPFRKETLPAEFGKVLGPIFILIGIILVIAGIRNEAEASERCDQQHREWMEGKRNFNDLEYGPPRGFFMVGGGGFAIVIGFGMLDSRSRNQPLLL